MQLAALLLVGGFEFLMLHSEPLLLQHDLLVQTGRDNIDREIWSVGSYKHDTVSTVSIFIVILVVTR